MWAKVHPQRESESASQVRMWAGKAVSVFAMSEKVQICQIFAKSFRDCT